MRRQLRIIAVAMALMLATASCFTKENKAVKKLVIERDSLVVLVGQLTDSLYNCQRPQAQGIQDNLNEILEAISQKRHENNAKNRVTMPVRPR